eukprot:g46216.t1
MTDDTKLGGSVCCKEDAKRLQSDLDRLAERANTWQMQCNVDKYKVIHFGRKSRKADCYLNGGSLGKGEVQQDTGVMVEQLLKVGMQMQRAVKKANGMLVFIARGFEYRSKNVLLQLYGALHSTGTGLSVHNVCADHTDNSKLIPSADTWSVSLYCLSDLLRPNQSLSTNTLIRLTELVLTLTNFSFKSSHFLQTKEMAMGTCMGPSYACLFTGYVEQSLFHCYTGTIPQLLLRYIDDCIDAASYSHEELEQSINFTFHPNLNFTWAISDTSLPFQDLSVSISGDRLETDIYFKLTDSHSYLDYTSSHPPS